MELLPESVLRGQMVERKAITSNMLILCSSQEEKPTDLEAREGGGDGGRVRDKGKRGRKRWRNALQCAGHLTDEEGCVCAWISQRLAGSANMLTHSVCLAVCLEPATSGQWNCRCFLAEICPVLRSES